MKTSEKTDKLTPAMCKAFGAMGAAFKTGKNPHFKSRYADLRAVDEASRAVLAEHDLFVTQGVVEGLGGLAMQTTIMHGASSQFISQLVPFVVPRGRTEDPQAYGSALTYSRRYGLQSALGMVSEDDDGEAAAKIARAQERPNAIKEAFNAEVAKRGQRRKAVAPGGGHYREDTSPPNPADATLIAQAEAIKDLKKACIDEGISLVLVEDFAQAELGMSVKELDSDKIASLKAEIMNRKDNFRKDK